jgi:hypothetical protein
LDLVIRVIEGEIDPSNIIRLMCIAGIFFQVTPGAIGPVIDSSHVLLTKDPIIALIVCGS